MLQLGDFVKVKAEVWASMFSGKHATADPNKPPCGRIHWMQRQGGRVRIDGWGYAFSPVDVELLWVDIDITEFE